jgi:hypothetical protein
MTADQQPAEDTTAAAQADEAVAPAVGAAEDVRVGPEQSDEPQAGAAEPTD